MSGEKSTKNDVIDLQDDLEIFHSCTDIGEIFFAKVIGCVENIVINEEFLELHSKFMEEHWFHFDDDEENKLIYTDIFRKYTETIEKYIETQLNKYVQGFDMKKFENELRKRQSDLDGEIFEMLSTFSDFIAFKAMFLDYKAMKEGKTGDFSQDLSVSKYDPLEIKAS